MLFRLGELIAYAETAAIFAERAACKPTNASGLEPATLQAMARIHAREALMKVATEGLRWAVGAGQTDPNLARALNLDGCHRRAGGADRGHGPGRGGPQQGVPGQVRSGDERP